MSSLALAEQNAAQSNLGAKNRMAQGTPETLWVPAGGPEACELWPSPPLPNTVETSLAGRSGLEIIILLRRLLGLLVLLGGDWHRRLHPVHCGLKLLGIANATQEH
jgi:hypothetical protein